VLKNSGIQFRHHFFSRLRLKAGGLIQYATVRSGESFLSGNELRIHFGLADHLKIDELQIRWLRGREED
jgi:hypothetical protein